MSDEQLEMFPPEVSPDWGDLPGSALTPSEAKEAERLTWVGFHALDAAADDGTSTANQDGEHRAARSVVHLLAAITYAQCRLRDRRQGWEDGP